MERIRAHGQPRGTLCADLSPVIAGCLLRCQDTSPALSRQEHSPRGRDSPAAAGFPPHLLQVDEDISYGRGLSSCHFGSGPKGLGKISTLLFHRQAPSKPGEWHNLWREGRTRECRGRLLATALKPLAPDPEVTSSALGEPPWHHEDWPIPSSVQGQVTQPTLLWPPAPADQG